MVDHLGDDDRVTADLLRAPRRQALGRYGWHTGSPQRSASSPPQERRRAKFAPRRSCGGLRCLRFWADRRFGGRPLDPRLVLKEVLLDDKISGDDELVDAGRCREAVAVDGPSSSPMTCSWISCMTAPCLSFSLGDPAFTSPATMVHVLHLDIILRLDDLLVLHVLAPTVVEAHIEHWATRGCHDQRSNGNTPARLNRQWPAERREDPRRCICSSQCTLVPATMEEQRSQSDSSAPHRQQTQHRRGRCERRSAHPSRRRWGLLCGGHFIRVAQWACGAGRNKCIGHASL